MGSVNKALNLIVRPLCKSPQARASEQVQFTLANRLPAGLLRSGNVFHPVSSVNDYRGSALLAQVGGEKISRAG